MNDALPAFEFRHAQAAELALPAVRMSVPGVRCQFGSFATHDPDRVKG